MKATLPIQAEKCVFNQYFVHKSLKLLFLSQRKEKQRYVAGSGVEPGTAGS